MKSMSLQQPWASLLCSGLYNIDHRGYAVCPYQYDVVICARPAAEGFSFGLLPFALALEVVNLENMGGISHIEHLPYNAAVGMARLECEVPLEEIDSEGLEKIKYSLTGTGLFAKPLFDIEIPAGLGEWPAGLALPRIAPRVAIERDGLTLRVPVGTSFFNRAERGSGVKRLVFNLLKDNAHLFCSRDNVPKPTERLVLVNGERRYVAMLHDIECYEVSADDSADVVEFRDQRERKNRWSQVNITFE